MRRRVGRTEIVHRIDDPPPEEIAPHPIDGGRGEIGVVRRGHPLGQGHPQVGGVALGRLAPVEEGRFDRLLGAGVGQGRRLWRPASPAGKSINRPSLSLPATVICPKNAASPQNWSWLQASKGWLWH